MTRRSWDEATALELVRKFVARELLPGVSVSSDDEDLVKAGLIDSMGWVGILSAIEESTGIPNFGGVWPKDRPQSIQALAQAVVEEAGSMGLPVSLDGRGVARMQIPPPGAVLPPGARIRVQFAR